MPTKKSDVVIDPSTGLPELPEGHFWRVETFEVAIWRKWTVHSIRKRRWPRSPVTEVVDHEERVVFQRQETMSWWVSGIAMPDASFDRVTEANLLPRAIAMYGFWKKCMAEHNESARITGDYPPKTINEKGK